MKDTREAKSVITVRKTSSTEKANKKCRNKGLFSRAIAIMALLLVLCLSMTSCLDGLFDNLFSDKGTDDNINTPISLDEIPPYSGKIYIEINGNQPYFTSNEITSTSYESYGELDSLGRCTITMASIGIDLMPTDDRESLSYNPTGWKSVKYDHISGKYLYNRCHLIGFQLAGENDNPNNLITGTRALNVDGMLLFENMVADYVTETGNHVMYRVTPIFKGNDLVARGVLMEGLSVEDDGDGICFCVYVYNNQDGVIINYATGDSCLGDPTAEVPNDGATDDNDNSTSSGSTTGGSTDNGADTSNGGDTATDTAGDYVINTATKKYHTEDCRYASAASTEHFHGTKGELESEGYTPCGVCKP